MSLTDIAFASRNDDLMAFARELTEAEKGAVSGGVTKVSTLTIYAHKAASLDGADPG